jgi:ATP-binding cassette subfamily B protein
LVASLVGILQDQPQVKSASANALTGNLLLTFDRETPAAEASSWVRRALQQAYLQPAPLAPAVAPATMSTDPMARLLSRLEPHRPLVVKMLASSFLNRLLDSAPALLIGAGMDVVTRGRASLLGRLGIRSVPSQLVALGGVGMLVWATDSVLDYVQRSSSAELAGLVRNELRDELYQHLQRLDMAQIESREVSEWLALLEGDLSRIHGFIKSGSDPMVAIVANSIAVLSTVLTLSPWVAVGQLLLLPPVLIASKGMLGPLTRRLQETRKDTDRLEALLHGNLSNLAAIKSFASQDREAERIGTAGAVELAARQAADHLSAIYVPTLTMIVGTGFMGTLVYGGLQVEKGRLTPAAYQVVTTIQVRMLAAIGAFGTSLDAYQRTSVSLRRVFDTLELRPVITSPTDAVPVATVRRDIVFDDVTFGYEPDRRVLRGLSLHFPAGQTVGIVGTSGAGKSTILKLLLRFYDVEGGAVRYDGVDVRHLRLDDLRRAVAMVSQEVAVFAGSIRENIAYARPAASEEDVEQAARVAEAHDFIARLPKRYDTRVGHGGLSLSAGQRQRLAIARVVLANRPVLLFDEATSALDFRTEAAVQRSIRQVTAGRTTVIVAHRLSTIRHADLIYVLDDGCVREQGRHAELVEADGIYASMWRVQTGELARSPAPAEGAA